MKSRINTITSFALIIAGILWATFPTVAQGPRSSVKTNTKIMYHNGPVVAGASNIYLVWYGCWRTEVVCGNMGSPSIQFVLSDFASHLGSSPYFQINSTYPNADGQAPSGGLLYGGSGVEPVYSHGNDLTETDIAGIVADQVLSSNLPLDPSALYIVITSEDIAANSVGFCSPGVPPHHGYSTVLGTTFRYGFIGHAGRCPTAAASQFVAADGTLLPSPNGDFAADAMASDMAHVLSTMVTDPYGSGWFDRYGLENADKCQGTFGQTFTTANGGRANMHLGNRDYLIQQNWVNDRRARCALSQ
ncbi:MAG: hypothetical protein ACJ72Z_03285 [Pyrinomonadaceae bacterium]